MIPVYSYYYGPNGTKGYDLKTTKGLTSVINEKILLALYTKESKTPTTFDQLHITPQGPVISITFITPSQAHDSRETYTNQSFFIRLSDVVDEVKKQLNREPDFPLKTSYLQLEQATDKCRESNGTY